MPNYKQATKKSIYEGKVNQLDDLGTNVNDLIQSELLSTIENICGDFIVRVVNNIDQENLPVTGQISDITLKTENGQVNIYGHPWLIYQDRGVSGNQKKRPNTPHEYTDKMPPVNVFVDWIKTKNIQLRDNEKYYGDGSPFKELTDDQKINKVAWGMAKNIQKYGFKARNVYSKEIPKLIDDLSEQIGNVSVDIINQVIDVKPDARKVIIKGR